VIDIFDMVFDTLYSSLAVSYPNANITAGFDERKTAGLTIAVREIANVPYVDGNTDNCAENFTRVSVEIEVDSDKKGVARSECKNVLSAADTIMQSMKFRRTYMSRAMNIDRTAFRQYARYEVIVGKPIVLNPDTQNEKTVYQMYRR